MRRVLYTAIITMVVMLGYPVGVKAATVEQLLNREYYLQPGYVEVKETLQINLTDGRFQLPAGTEKFIVFNPIPNDSDAEKKISQTQTTIRVTDSNGRSLPFTTNVSGQNLEINVSRQQPVTKDKPFAVTVTYKSYSLLYQTGAVWDFYPPAFSKDFVFSSATTNLEITTKIYVPKSIGEINFSLPKQNPVSQGESWVFNYTQDQLTGAVAWIQIGTTQFYGFEMVQPYPKTSDLSFLKNELSVVLPRDYQGVGINQSVFFTSIQPAPTSTVLDSDGNLIANFSLPANMAGEIKINGYVKLQATPGKELPTAGLKAALPTTLSPNLTAAAPFWESDSSAVKTAAQSLAVSEDVLDLTRKTYQFVVDKIDYSNVKRFGINQRQGALKTLEGGAAVCMEYSDLFIALMRAQGIPTRGVFGFGYDPRAGDTLDTAHQWAEVFLPLPGQWLAVDTTWGESGSAAIGPDLNHFYHYVASTNPQEPAPVSAKFFGSLAKIPETDFKIFALSAAQPEATITQEALLRNFPPNTGVLDLDSDLVIAVGISITLLLCLAIAINRIRRRAQRNELNLTTNKTRMEYAAQSQQGQTGQTPYQANSVTQKQQQ